MIHAIKKQVTVKADGSIHIYVPEFKEGTVAEVIVRESEEQAPKRSLVKLIGKGQGSFSTPEEADSFVINERTTWE